MIRQVPPPATSRLCPEGETNALMVSGKSKQTPDKVSQKLKSTFERCFPVKLVADGLKLKYVEFLLALHASGTLLFLPSPSVSPPGVCFGQQQKNYSVQIWI